jgi:hypothetical protein
MITERDFDDIICKLRADPDLLNGMSLDEHIQWSEAAKAPTNADDFALEAIFVICNSGMKHTVARRIYDRCSSALLRGEPVVSEHRAQLGLTPVFGHHRKASAMEDIWQRRDDILVGYLAAEDKIEFCGSLPWIGGITKYHLAKNFGADVAKPDVHLVRLATAENTTPQELCDRLAKGSGYKSRTVDLILWLGCAKGILKVPRMSGSDLG